MKINKRQGFRFCPDNTEEHGTWFRVFLFISVTFCGLLLKTTAIWAQTYSLSIWPPLLEVMVQPGRTVTQVYKITNSADEQILVAKVLPFEPKDEFGNINLLNIPSLLNPLSFSFEGSGITLGRPFLLKSGESKDLVLKLTVPKRTPEKDFYASLVFETSPVGKIGLSQSQTAAKIAGNLLITVSTEGKPAKKAKILEFSAPKIIDCFDPVHFILRIENINSAFFKPFGEIKIEGIFNQQGKIKLLPENILAGYSRNLTISPWKEKFIVGPFRAKAEFSLDPPENGQVPEGEKLSAETNFLALPYKAILALIVICLILLTFKNLPKKITK